MGWIEKNEVFPSASANRMARKKKESTLMGRQAKDYAGASTIHGLTYIAEEGRPRVEK